MLMKSILDKSFKYTPSINTNLRATFAKARKEMAKEAAQSEADALVVRPFPTRVKK